MPDFETPPWQEDDPVACAIVRELVQREPDADMLLDMLGLDL